MLQKDDLSGVKSIAINLLNMDVKEGALPNLVEHPIFENRVEILLPEGAVDFTHMRPVDILADAEGLKEIRKKKTDLINNCENVESVVYMVRKAYRLAFLKLIQEFLSEKTFSELLGEIWVNVENPNVDINVSVDTLLEWFRSADKTVLMNKDEWKTYQGLPDEVQVYRGVGDKSNVKGLSWTLSLEKAKWFADRYKMLGTSGYVVTAIAKKEDILAYFAGRQEEEVIIDGNRLDVKKLDK